MWHPTCLLHIVILSLVFHVIQSLDNSYFWHISDLHVDQNYSRTGNPLDLCHSADGKSFPDNGLYGNFLCDSPLYLVNVTIESMKQIHSKPDFIIWTGDNLPHTDTDDPTFDVTYEAIKNISYQLVSTFPGVPVLPCIGNHDTFPPNTLPPEDGSESIYKGYLEKGGWSELIPKEAWPTFLQGGYFSQVVKDKLRIISLNTILWYTPNNLTAEIADPANQFRWLDQVLKNSSKFSEKVYIIGHVAPGFYNRVFPGQKADSTYHPQHLDAIIKILHKYSKIIIGQMYGHYHLDFFTVSQYNTGFFMGSALLASSVTPWHTMDEFNTSLPVNPTIRLMHASPYDASLLDFDQFYLNLTKANSIKESGKESESLLYEKLYTFTDFYKVKDLSTQSLVEVYERLKRDPDLFNSFYTFLSAGEQSTTCDDSCKVAQLCSMSCTSKDEYDNCMRNVDSVHHITQRISQKTPHINSAFIYGSVILGIVIVLLATFLLYRKFRKPRSRSEYQPFSHF